MTSIIEVQLTITSRGTWDEHNHVVTYINQGYSTHEYGHNGHPGFYYTDTGIWYKLADNHPLGGLFEARGKIVTYSRISGTTGSLSITSSRFKNSSDKEEMAGE